MNTKANDAIPPVMLELHAVADELEASYWVPLLKTPFSSLDKVEHESKEDCPPLQQCFAAFNSNLRAARDLLEFPYLLIAPLLPAVRGAAEQFPSFDADLDELGISEERRVRIIEFVTSTLRSTKGHLAKKQPELQRLLHQACLLIWSAVETYCKQVFITALNEKPSLLKVIYQSPQLKERFGIPNTSWLSLLESHDFNLQGKLGTIIAANRDFSSPQLLRDLFPPLFADLSGIGFPEPIFQSDALWKLGQRRHLIAHRCGIVDQDYLDKTHDENQHIGKLLNLRGRDVAAAMGAAASFAILLYGNARYCWPRSDN